MLALWLASALAGAAWGLSSLPLSQPHDGSAERQAEQKAPAVSPDGSDDRIADYTLWLAIFSGLLVGVAGIQAIFLYRTNKVAAASAKAAQQAANIAQSGLNPHLLLRVKTHFLKPVKTGFHKDAESENVANTISYPQSAIP